MPLALLVGDQEIHAVQRHPAIVADDAAAPVGIGQAGDDARRPRLANVRRIGVEHAVIVRLAILGEDLTQERIGLVAVGFEAIRHHAPAAERHDRPLERRLGLQPDDQLVRLVDIARRVRHDAGRHLRDVEDALFPFLREERLQGLPYAACAVGRSLQEGTVAFVGGVVSLDEFAHVDPAAPTPRCEAAPCSDVILPDQIDQRGCHDVLPRPPGRALLPMPGSVSSAARPGAADDLASNVVDDGKAKSQRSTTLGVRTFDRLDFNQSRRRRVPSCAALTFLQGARAPA